MSGWIRVATPLLSIWLLVGSPAWVFAQDDATIRRGKEVYERWCAPCHADGPAYPGTTALATKYEGTGTPALLEARTDLSPASIEYFVRRGVSVMPFFRKTEISDTDLDALAAYLAQAHLTQQDVALEQLQHDLDELEKRVSEDPRDHASRTALAPAHYNLGVALAEQGRTEEAIGHYQRAIDLKPSYHEAHNNLGGAFVRLERLEEAATHFRLALQFDSRNAEAHVNLGSLLETQGDINQAIREYEAALALGPDDAGIYHHLGRALAAQGRGREAIARYGRSVELRPDYVPALVDLAWLLASSPEADLRDGRRAIALAERARQLIDGDHFIVLDTVAAAYASAGEFDRAIPFARSAIELAERAGVRPAAVDDIRDRLQAYIERRAYVSR